MAIQAPRMALDEALALPSILGVVHFTVDASSNFVMASSLRTQGTGELVASLFLYNALAFALQPIVGVVTDHWRAPRAVLTTGLLLAAAAMVVSHDASLLAIVLAGLGNAAFHVGAGIVASGSTRAKAAGLGIFIGPGAVGVVVGAVAAGSAPSTYWLLLGALAVFAPLSALLPNADASPAPERDSETHLPPRPIGIILLLLGAIAGRAFLGARVGARVAHDFGASLIIALAVAACVGKVVGGVLADRAGWKRSTLGFLTASFLLLAFGTTNPWSVLGSVALFQAVTGITLAAMYRVMPRRTGLAFGLACLALFLGSLPTLLHINLGTLEQAPVNGLVAVVSAGAIWLALSWLDQPPAPKVLESRFIARAAD